MLKAESRPPRIGIAIVNYNVKEFLRGCLQSLRTQVGVAPFETWVVDNASKDGSVEMVRQEFPEVHLIALPANLGYVKGNNLAIRGMQALAQPPEYVLLLNPDTVLSPHALARMIALMDEFPAIGAAGPRLELANGEIDWACRRGFPTPSASFFHMVGLSRLFPRSRLFARYRLAFIDERAVADVDSVVGAFMLVRREAIEQVGLLDEDFFMYGEDLDWAFRLKQAGWRVVYNGKVDIRHFKRESSRQSRRARVEFYRAMLVFFRKHYAPATPAPLRFAIEASIRALWAAAAIRSRLSAAGARG